jgi:hypothetical protein
MNEEPHPLAEGVSTFVGAVFMLLWIGACVIVGLAVLAWAFRTLFA